MKGFKYSVSSGCLAATASLLGKLAMSSGQLLEMIDSVASRFAIAINSTAIHDYMPLFQIALFILMILTNGLMWTTFTKALAASRTTIEATVVNTASNFVVTAMLGRTFFGELVGLLWWLGSAMILIGLIFVKVGSDVQVEQNEIETRHQTPNKVKRS